MNSFAIRVLLGLSLSLLAPQVFASADSIEDEALLKELKGLLKEDSGGGIPSSTTSASGRSVDIFTASPEPAKKRSREQS